MAGEGTQEQITRLKKEEAAGRGRTITGFRKNSATGELIPMFNASEEEVSTPGFLRKELLDSLQRKQSEGFWVPKKGGN